MFVGYNVDYNVDYIVSPLGGDKWLLKMYLSLNNSFKRLLQKRWFIQ